MAQGSTKGVPIDTDGTLSLDSDLLVPSQKAVKTYVDNHYPTRRTVITLADGQGTPSGTGPYSAIKRIPYDLANASMTWTVKRVWFRVENPSANTSTIQVQYSAGGTNQIFSGSNLQTAGLSITGATTYENSTTSMAQATLTSGQLIQVNVSAVGSGQTGWSVEVELEA